MKTDNPWDKDYEGNQLAPIYEPLWKMLQAFLKSVPVNTVLDFGCGDGNYAFLMNEAGFDVTGIDASAKAIGKAIAHKKTCHSEKCRVIRHDSIPDNLPYDSFDAVIMFNSLHCLAYKERTKIIAQIKRVLKQNGYLFASVLALEDESYPRHEWKEIEENTFEDGDGKIFHFYSLNELTQELKRFQILRSDVLENVHPEVNRKSSLYVISAKNVKDG